MKRHVHNSEWLTGESQFIEDSESYPHVQLKNIVISISEN
jgi:hypothetical protein